MECKEARRLLTTPVLRKIFPIDEKDRILELEALAHIHNCDECYEWHLAKINELNDEVTTLDDDLENLEDAMRNAKSREERKRVVSKYKESRRGQG